MDGVELWQGDCLDLMERIPTGTVDLILADLPYGTTNASWDSVIPLKPLWAHYKRVLKTGGAIVLTASQPFTSVLTLSNLPWFKYDLVWDKCNATGHLNAKKMPMRQHESILVFAPGRTTYNPQMEVLAPGDKRLSPHGRSNKHTPKSDSVYNSHEMPERHETGMRYPKSVVSINNTNATGKVHPTQKPVPLGEYLILTYTTPGEVVLDNTMGSGSFGVAAVNTGRRFIGIEKDAGHFATAERRIADAVRAKDQSESRPVVAQGRLF